MINYIICSWFLCN